MNGFGNMPVNPPQNDDVVIVLGCDSPRRTANHGRSDLDPGGFCALEKLFVVFEQI